METHDLNSWHEFRPTIESIRERYGSHQWFNNSRQNNTLLYRGQACAEWTIQTTLERSSDRKFSVQSYMNHVSRCHHELESLTDKRWAVPDYHQLESQISTNQTDTHPHLPCYDFLVYLRHHGFPSPLLDWTTSPYIAAFFAYIERPSSDRVAVYVFIETPLGGKGWQGNPPMIRVMGPYVSTHTRHFAQKAWYTITTQYQPEHDKHVFCPHSAVYGEGHPDQDVLVKITMPATDRLTALKELDDYNINHFTLFQTEDALVKALAIKEFELRHL